MDVRILALALAVLLVGSAEAKTPKYWTCTDTAGHKSAQDFPCSEPLSVDAAQPAISPKTEAPVLSQPQVQQRAAAPPKSKAAKIDVAGSMLGPLIPLFWIFMLALLAIFALKIWITTKATKTKVQIGTKIVRDVIARIEPTDDLLIRGYAPKVIVPKPRPTHWSLDLIRRLEWKRFEELCEGYWRAKGYRAELTGKGADGGVDVNLYAPSDPARLFAVIQCKSWVDQVGVKEIRELWGVTSHLSIKLALFYGLSGFTEEARAFASNKHFKLFTGEDLLAQIQALSIDQQSALLDHVTRDDYTTPTCPQCDVKMALKEASKGSREGNKFWGCKNYPKCKQTFHLNAARSFS